MTNAHDSTEGETGSAAQQHARRENGLSESAIIEREGVGNHRLGSGGVRGFTNANHGAGDEQHGEGGSEAAGNAGEAPDEHAGGDDFGLAEAIGKIAGGNTEKRENNQEAGLEGAELRVGYVEMGAEQRNERIEDLAVGKVDKIDQSKYSKKANLRE